MICFVVALGSAIVTGDLEETSCRFRRIRGSYHLASVTMFVIGFGVAIGVCPMSESGQKTYLCGHLICCGGVHCPLWCRQNIATLLICRVV